jgi:toxin CptA
LLFLAADFGLGLVVRYVYFAAPLVCLAVGALLAALWGRQGGRLLAIALALLVAWSGTALWVAGVLERVKPSVLPLTH